MWALTEGAGPRWAEQHRKRLAQVPTGDSETYKLSEALLDPVIVAEAKACLSKYRDREDEDELWQGFCLEILEMIAASGDKAWPTWAQARNYVKRAAHLSGLNKVDDGRRPDMRPEMVGILDEGSEMIDPRPDAEQLYDRMLYEEQQEPQMIQDVNKAIQSLSLRHQTVAALIMEYPPGTARLVTETMERLGLATRVEAIELLKYVRRKLAQKLSQYKQYQPL